MNETCNSCSSIATIAHCDNCPIELERIAREKEQVKEKVYIEDEIENKVYIIPN